MIIVVMFNMKEKRRVFEVKRNIKILVGVAMLLIASGIIVMGVACVKYVLSPENNSADSVGDNKVNIMGEDGVQLVALEKHNIDGTHQWAILVHSYRTNHTFMNSYAQAYQQQGYNTLQPDNRAHGQSGGKYIGMGYLDQYDIRCWIDYILKKDPEAEIVLHGVSMGAATLMMLSGQDNLPDNVKAIIEDCGYKSARDYLTWKLKQRFHLPGFPVIPIANIAFKLSAGYYMDDASALEAVKNSNIPTLFIHGTEDQTVPVEEVYELYEAATCQKEIYIVEGAGHGEALVKNEDEYWIQVFGFIDSFLYNSKCRE